MSLLLQLVPAPQHTYFDDWLAQTELEGRDMLQGLLEVQRTKCRKYARLPLTASNDAI